MGMDNASKPNKPILEVMAKMGQGNPERKRAEYKANIERRNKKIAETIKDIEAKKNQEETLLILNQLFQLLRMQTRKIKKA